jgi:isocitrate/isopropylmalate dehydrogenase
LEQVAVADRVEKAVHSVYQEGRRLNRDCGTASTDEFTSALIGALA